MAKFQTAHLFPIWHNDPSTPVGIARLAGAAQRTDQGHLIGFKAMEVRGILNKSVSKRQHSLHFTDLQHEYAARFAKDDFATGLDLRKLSERVARICSKYGLAARSTDALRTRDMGSPWRPAANVGSVVEQRLFA